MTEPVEEEEVRAPLDPPDEDEVMPAKTLDYGEVDDIETPKAPESVSDAVEEGMEGDEGEMEPEEAEAEPEGVIERTPEEYAEEEHGAAPAEESPEYPTTHKVKINGEEYDLSTDDLIAGYQQAAASQQKFQRAAEVEKAARNVIDNVLNPETSVDTMIDLYTDQMGGDREKAADMVDEIIGKRIQHLINLEEMSEDERKLHDLEAEKERMAAQLEAAQADQKAQQQAEYIKYQNSQAVPLLDRAISKYNLEVGSAQDAEASQILAEYVRQGHSITQDLADQTVAEVINRRQDLLHSTLSGMTPEDLLSTNPDLAKQVQQAKAEELKASRTTETGTNQGSTPKRRRKAKESEYTSSNEFFNDTDFS